MRGNGPESVIPNREHHNQITSGCGSAEKLPLFLAARVSCRDDHAGPFNGFLDLFRVDPMPGNMADVVQIPIEAFCAIQHSYSIYNYCIYRNAPKPCGPTDRAAAINTLESKNVRIIRRSEVSAPAICYLALEFPAGKRLFARCGDLIAKPSEIPAEF